ncbi:MAG: hypothetical protein SF187_08795 [Deltaproteobacteria bacterium]|nr:hypothetical protein [Deltaproteobacteria bacterium]
MRNGNVSLASVIQGAVVAVALLAPAAARGQDPLHNHLALGAAPMWEARNDYGEGSRMNFAPELLGFYYIPTSHERYHVRVGARLGFSGLAQADMPTAVQLQERDVRPALEIGLLRDGPVIPVIALGVGAVARHVALKTQAPVSSVQGSQGHSEVLPRAYGHVALGVPFGDGRVVLEPFGRYEMIVGDTRSTWRFGLDVSVLLF